VVGGVHGHDRGDDLRIGGDGAGDAQVVVHLDVGVVVDVAVEHGHRVRQSVAGRLLGAAELGLLAVHRVAVGFADDADAGPASVAEHRHASTGLRQRQPQQTVGVHRGTQRLHVVAQLADLGSGLVDETQALAGDTHAAALEQRVGAAGGDGRRHRRRSQIEAVAPHQHVDAGAVAAAHFHPVDGAERLLDGQVAGDGGLTGVAPGEVGDGVGRADAVLAHGPHGVAHGQQFGVDALDVLRRQAHAGFEFRVERGNAAVELVEARGKAGDQFAAPGERQHARHTLQQFVDLCHQHGSLGERAGSHRLVEQTHQLGGRRSGPAGWPGDDRDDAAHDEQVTDPTGRQSVRRPSGNRRGFCVRIVPTRVLCPDRLGFRDDADREAGVRRR
jgi:hypothetical protein